MLLNKEKRFPEEIVKFYAVQIIDAVRCMHSKNFIHRDLTLENILVDERGYIQIIDFGNSKRIDD